jgi:hypothetical protein
MDALLAVLFIAAAFTICVMLHYRRRLAQWRYDLEHPRVPVAWRDTAALHAHIDELAARRATRPAGGCDNVVPLRRDPRDSGRIA